MVEDTVRQTLWRNVVDLQLRREVLKTYHIPTKRGVLLYGPPGTGKSLACRYLCGKLPDTTRILAAGSALSAISGIFAFARALQPSLLILEDVDLVFASRDQNPHNSVLGELLDQMDGM